MIQQDTFWADSLSSVDVDARSEDIIFDRASEVGDLIAGGYYYAKPSPSSITYFERLSKDISWWYAPDNAYMTSLCELSGLARCGGLPFRTKAIRTARQGLEFSTPFTLVYTSVTQL
ncbi:unnamed protein product [Cylicostephanus goldi]|uniref:Nucleotide-diphospho-sugar transferase domain-containing protein n=1 Tax=Cylicostephanus goldi TaxID=71465 RepID=A0A3P7PX99_CYLGO|nr:unnamed protein product [Cylicostephanus goldi]